MMDIGTVGILAGVALLFGIGWLLVTNIPAANSGAPLSREAENVIGMVAIALAFASVLLSINFPLSLTGSQFVKWVMLIMFLGFVIIQYSMTFWLSAFWIAGKLMYVFATLFLMAVTIGISIMAGQSFLADVTAGKETQLRQASDTYKLAVAERQAAADAARELAVSDGAGRRAQAELARLEDELRTYSAGQAQNSTGRAVGTVASVIAKYGCGGFYAGYCAEVARLEAAADEQRDVLSRWSAYQGATAHAQALSAQALPTAIADARVPGFQAVANITGWDYETVRDNFWIYLSAFTEAAAQLCFIFWGWSRRRAGNSIPPAQVTRPHLDSAAVPALFSGGHIVGDGLAHLHSGEAVLNPGAVAALTAMMPGFIDFLNGAGLAPVPDSTGVMPDSTTPRQHQAREASAPVPDSIGTGAGTADAAGKSSSRGDADVQCLDNAITALLDAEPGMSQNALRKRLRDMGHKGNDSYLNGRIHSVKGQENV